MFRRRISLAVLVLGASIALSQFIMVGMMAFPHGVSAAATVSSFANPPGGCQVWTLDLVHLSVHPNQGATWPNAIIRRGTTAQLVGTAQRQQRDQFCSVTTTDLPFSWSATYQADDGSNAVDATGGLVGTGTLTPTLNASNAGWYVVRLSATRAATVTIQVLDDGYRWVNIGPDGRPSQAVGRVNAIAFDPSQQGKVYVGTANGGVWKSLDGGRNWQPLMDSKGLPTLGIGAVAVTPAGVVYAGLGDSSDFGSGDKARPGTGIYVSADGGVTWNPTGTGGAGCGIVNASGTYQNAIRRIIVDPNTSSTIYAAGDAGVFRSTDGGACWTSIRPSIPSGQIIDDIALNPLQLLAVSRQSGVYGTPYPTTTTPTWSPVLSPPCGSPLRAALAQSASTGYVYASFGCSSVQIRLSTTYGDVGSWSPVPALNVSTQLDYNFALAVDPQSATRIYQGTVDIWRYQGPSGSWQNWDGPNASTPTPNALGFDVHSDFHALTFDPFNPNWLYAGTDGGVYRFDVSGNPAAAATNWTVLNGNLAISQFYMLGVNPNWPGDVAGGLQDNATPRRLTGRAWSGVPGNGGDGYQALYDASIPTLNGVPSPLYSVLYVPGNSGSGGDFVRSDPFASSQPVIANVNELWSDPYRPGVMIATSPGSNMAGAGGQLYYGTDATTALPMIWTCIDPTPANLNDVVRSVGFARAFPSGSGGLYYVGLDSGSIYLVDAQSSPPIRPNCGADGNALRGPALQVYTPTVGTIGEINGIAEDPNRPCRIYATSVNAPNAAYRVVRVEGTQSTAGCTGPWVSQPIAGLPPAAGSLPNTLNGQGFGLHRWAVAVDPWLDTLVYVGTYAGLYQGKNTAGVWGWSRVLDVPDTLVTDVKAQVNASGPWGTLYATTFGRGAYERVVVGPAAVAAQTHLAGTQAVASAITRCQARPMEDPDLHYRVADVEIEYQYDGAHGTLIRVRPNVLVDGLISPYFIREIRDVVSGTHTANMHVIYGAADEPPGLTTNGLQVEMYVEGGSSFLVSDCPFVHTWRRPDARSLEVRAEDAPDEGAPALVSVPITVTLAGGGPQAHIAPFTLVVTQGITISLQAPVLRTEHAHASLLHAWTLVGHADMSHAPIFGFTLNDDSAAVARYILLEDRVYLPVIMR